MKYLRKKNLINIQNKSKKAGINLFFKYKNSPVLKTAKPIKISKNLKISRNISKYLNIK